MLGILKEALGGLIIIICGLGVVLLIVLAAMILFGGLVQLGGYLFGTTGTIIGLILTILCWGWAMAQTF